jgi:nitrous oxidase accessory protein
MVFALFTSLLVVAQGATGMAATFAGQLPGRPPAESLSPLQQRVDEALPGTTIDVGPGTYHGDLFIDRPVALVGRGRPTLVGSGRGSVVVVRAADVRIEGFAIDGRLGGSLGDDSSGVYVAAHRVTVRDVHIVRTFFGVYLRNADEATIERTVIRGVPGVDPGEQGSGLHVYDTQGFRLVDNDIEHMRDGIYIQSSHRGLVQGNLARYLRYGLHYMYSDDNTFEDNRFEDSAAGAALMYSKRLTFRRNRFLHNRGFASVGLLLKDCEDLVAEDNLVADNARGLFLEGSDRNTFRRNVVAVSDVAIVLFDSSHGNVFEANAFLANQSPLELVGRRSDTRFDGNYWSDADEPDLDGDNVRDRPYRLSSVFDHFRGNLIAAELFARGPAARALGAAERTFPVLAATTVEDRRPLVRPPLLPDVPAHAGDSRRANPGGMMMAASTTAVALAVIAWGRRRRAPGAEA